MTPWIQCGAKLYGSAKEGQSGEAKGGCELWEDDQPGGRLEMIDSWTKKSPSGKTVTFKIEGDRKSGFAYSAKMDGRDVQEIKGFLEELPREAVEVLFVRYVAEK
jgi:hypothetical protein